MGRAKGGTARRLLTAVVLVGLLADLGGVARSAPRDHQRTTAVHHFITALAERQAEELGIPDAFFPFLHGEGLDDARVRTGRALYAEPAPDLNHDSVPELLESDLRYRYEIGGGQGLTEIVEDQVKTRITVRTGSNGHKLWKKTYETDAYPFAMRVGADGEHGVVVISGLWNFYGTGDQNKLRFDAFDRRGKKVWSREYTSVSYYDLLTYVTEDAPMVIAKFDGLEGRAEDLMIGFATQLSTLVTTTTASRVVVIDGASGEEHAHPLVDIGIDWWPIPLPTGDLDGDGLDDYATTNNLGADLGEGQEAPSFGGTVYARKGTAGTPIWTTSGIDMAIWAFTEKLPDVVADGTEDVGLSTYVEKTADLLPVNVPLTGVRYEARVYLFDGLTGGERWHRKSEWVYSPGDIDDSGKDDLVLGLFRMSFKKSMTTFEQEAVTGGADRLWHNRSIWRFETMPCPEGFCFGGYGYYLDPTPDLQPDRVNDVVFSQSVNQNAAFDDSITRAYDGRTGEMRFQDDAFLQSVGVAIDGRGTDLISFEPEDGKMRATARDGNNNTIWTGLLGGPEKILPKRSWFWADGFVLPGDRCGDLVINGAEEDQSFYGVFDGDSGKLLWWRWTGPKADRPTFTNIEDHNHDC